MLKKIVLTGAGLLGVVVLIILFQLLYPGRPDQVPAKPGLDLVAHRGLHTNWEKGAYDRATGCEAAHMLEPTQPYIENTLPSIGAAFELGATIVEIDIRRTSDDRLVIFHDYDLTCRTDGVGQVGDQPLTYLKGLDIGYGYTTDGGRTFPLRGQGVGLMPTLEEVLGAFPDRRFLIDHKDGTLETADLLIDILDGLPADQQAKLYYWGPPPTRAYVQASIPAITPLFGTRPEVRDCLLPYVLRLGLAGFPKQCDGMGLGLPVEYLKYVPGWPYGFLSQVADAGARFYVIAETEAGVESIVDLPIDGIETDHIEIVGPVVSSSSN
jgi:glycerophosphoryl diester phosphodiesterase